jgi:DNA-binding IclR family transcriptional regulator
LPDEQVVALYRKEDLPTLTPRSVATRDELLRQLALVRSRGYASSTGESEAGVSSLAIALPRAHGQRLAFNVALPASRMNKPAERRVATALRAVAADAAGLLVARGVTPR